MYQFQSGTCRHQISLFAYSETCGSCALHCGIGVDPRIHTRSGSDIAGSSIASRYANAQPLLQSPAPYKIAYQCRLLKQVNPHNQNMETIHLIPEISID